MRTIGFAVLLAGCTDAALPQESALDRLRLLAAQAEPAEPRPGDMVSLQSLQWSPTGEVVGVVWELCASEECPSPARRSDPAAILEEGALDPAEGLIGLEPAVPATMVVPERALDALDEAERQEGIALIVGLSATDGVEVEWGTKALPVSEAETPNNNPELIGILVDDAEVLPGGELLVSAGAEVELALLSPELVEETYRYRNSDGETEERVESLAVSWYTDLGEIGRGDRWLVSSSGGSGELIVVVRDGRGGTGWLRWAARAE